MFFAAFWQTNFRNSMALTKRHHVMNDYVSAQVIHGRIETVEKSVTPSHDDELVTFITTARLPGSKGGRR